jgi:SAM-dependent methyltransferase
VRNLLVIGAAALVIGVVCWFLPRTEWTRFGRRNGTAIAVGCLGMGGYMLLGSKYGKIREREWLLDLKPGGWRGDEAVLDVGCGRGVMLIGAAKRLTTGSAVGVDIWQARDLSGNTPEAPIENARREGVAERVTVKTADMRQMPFPDGHFDVVVSNAAVHNLSKAAERDAAVREMARVLRPGGACILADVRHEGQYTRGLKAAGVTEVRRRDASVASLFFWVVSLGRARPFVVVASKPG